MIEKDYLVELLAESLSKSFFLPFKEILKLEKIPQSIYMDNFLGTFLLSHISEYSHILELHFSVKLDTKDLEKIIKKADPDNYEFVLKVIRGELDIWGSNNEEAIKGSEIAKKALYLTFRSKFSILLKYDENDEDIVFAFKKSEVVKEVLRTAYPDSPVIEDMTNDDLAAQTIYHFKIFSYLKENKEKFL